MPTYGYRCSACGVFALRRPMTESDAATSCPRCGAASRRTFGTPALAALDPRLRRALDASTRSADDPTVVTSVPGRPRRATPVTRDPRHTRLPRP